VQPARNGTWDTMREKKESETEEPVRRLGTSRENRRERAREGEERERFFPSPQKSSLFVADLRPKSEQKQKFVIGLNLSHQIPFGGHSNRALIFFKPPRVFSFWNGRVLRHFCSLGKDGGCSPQFPRFLSVGTWDSC
jgi:hypothetical protein